MIEKENLETYMFVKQNREIFDDIQDKYSSVTDQRKKLYTILNYGKILDDIYEYVDGYIKYEESDDDKYGDKVIASTAKFYDAVFREQKYRTTMTLPDMPDIAKEFLRGTKKLQNILLQMNECGDDLKQMQVLTDNEYRRISKVFKDDINIWKWQSGLPGYITTTELRQKFRDKSTPVMHEK